MVQSRGGDFDQDVVRPERWERDGDLFDPEEDEYQSHRTRGNMLSSIAGMGLRVVDFASAAVDMPKHDCFGGFRYHSER